MDSQDQTEDEQLDSGSGLLLQVDLEVHDQEREDQQSVRHLWTDWENFLKTDFYSSSFYTTRNQIRTRIIDSFTA